MFLKSKAPLLLRKIELRSLRLKERDYLHFALKTCAECQQKLSENLCSRILLGHGHSLVC